MFNSRFWVSILILFIINMTVSSLCSILIPDVYLAQIVTSVVLAFVFAIYNQWIDRPHFYKYQQFWYTFFIMGIVFCLFDLVVFLI